VLVAPLGLTSQLTPAMRIGPWSGRLAVLMTGFGAALALLPYRRAGRAAAARAAAPPGPVTRELAPSTEGKA
jgi:apolipoprotein N-acyltransferase